MFRIKSDNNEIYNLKDEENYIVESPKLTLELNKSGELTFYIPPTHPNYNNISGLTSKIQLFNNNNLEFAGRTIENKDAFNKRRYVKIEGELSYLCDSIQKLAVYKCTPYDFFAQIIANHNSQVEESKQFRIGMFTITDSNNYIYRYTNYENTLTTIKEKLIDSLGGFLRVRYANGHRYLDLLADYGKTNSQVIRFGENILDLNKYIKFSSICTAMIPLGTELDETVSTGGSSGTIKKRLTLSSYPDGEYGDIVKSGDMIYSKSGVQNYGYIYADKSSSTFKDITLVANLFSKGVTALSNMLQSSLTIELNAVDLNLINVDIEKIELGDRIKVLSPPHNLNDYFIVSKIVKDLANPKNNKITLGQTFGKLSNAINRNNTENNNLMNELSGDTGQALEDAKRTATDLIVSVEGGYAKIKDGEIFIADNENLNEAQKVWRWNLNGLGYSNTGVNGQFGTAITMDGQIVADYITTGHMSVARITGLEEFRKDNLLINSNFSADNSTAKGWGNPGSTGNGFTRELIQVNNKTWLHLASTNTSIRWYGISQAGIKGKFKPNTKYTVSFLAYGTGNVRIGIHENLTGSGIIEQYWKSIKVSNEIKRYDYTFTTTSSNIDNFNFMVYGQDYGLYDFYITEIKFEEGEYPTSWNDNLSDHIRSAINLNPDGVLISGDAIDLTASKIINILSGNEINLTSKNITWNSTYLTIDKYGNMTLKPGSSSPCIYIHGTINSNELQTSLNGYNLNIQENSSSRMIVNRLGNYNGGTGWNAQYYNISGSTASVAGEIQACVNSSQTYLTLKHGSTSTTIGYSSISSPEVKKQGCGEYVYCRQSNHTMSLQWTNQLDFFVDVTNVGTLSDKRLKADIEDINPDLIKAISECKLKQFKAENRNGLISVGIIAQELIQKCNEYNIEDPFQYEVLKEMQYKIFDEQLYYSIEYEQFLILKNAYLENKINELNNKVEILERKVG